MRFFKNTEDRMEKRFWMVTGLIALWIVAAACAPTRLEMDYGTSAKLSKFNQILSPEASKNLEPVTGFDGGAAKATMDKYQKDFEKPSTPPSYTISVGSLGK
jgi:hypothetical protein